MTEAGERIAKFIAHAGVASRRDAEVMITDKRVKLNNVLVTHPATFVAEGDIVTVDGTPVGLQKERTRLFKYHKPEGLVVTHKDPQGRPTVFEKMPAALPRVVSVGRLDLNSEGLLLLTNDGALARQLELPVNAWIRRYRVRAFGDVDPAALAALAKGITIEGIKYGAIEAGLDSRKGDNIWLTVALKEGKNREVRKVLAHMGLQVSRLIRVAYGPFQLGTLPRGVVEEVPSKVLREQIKLAP
jgi:23S rRNA pseudouridine2605 synthase